jgi:N-methylhydantoinase B
MPVEVFESRSPLVMLERQLRPDSGGAGRLRGGLGYRAVYSGMRLQTEYRLSPFTDRIRERAPGLAGGLAGAPGFFGRVDGTQLDGKRTAVTGPDELIAVETPGGGGFGPPAERDPTAVLEDVRRGYVTIDEAANQYLVAINGNHEVDVQETSRLRGAEQPPAGGRGRDASTTR